MLQLIFGGAGSGKSTMLTEMIRQDVECRKKAYLLIPEQQANLSERTMLPKLPTNAGLTFTITGFSRLVGQVADRFGGAAVSPLEKGFCSLLMWQNLRDLNGILEEYSSSTPRSDANLTKLLLSTIEELRKNGITPAKLESTANRLPLNSALRPKLRDLSLLTATYDNSLTDLFEDHAGDPLDRLADLLETHDFFASSHVYIDSFSSFTAQEYTILRSILKQADKVIITICSHGDPACTAVANPAFDSSVDTTKRLRELCEKEHIPVESTTLYENHRTCSPELVAMEENLWNLALSGKDLPVMSKTARGAITMQRASNIYAEAEAVAYQILNLVHHGTRYEDIALFVRDTEKYRGILDAALERHNIPFYFSEKTSLTEKPLSRLLISALRAVAQGFPAHEILTMLKTGLCPVSMHDADLFDEYVNTWNITGADFTVEEFIRNPDGYVSFLSERGKEILTAANRVREAIIPPLLTLYTDITGGRTLPDLCCALYNFMNALSLSDRCAALAENELSTGYVKEAGETIRIFDTVIQILTQISTHLPNLILEPEEFAAALNLVFSQTEIASVPSLFNSITIGDAATLRVENISAAFVLGLNEGEFPMSVESAGLLTNSEKQQMAELGLALDSRAEIQSSDELFYIYRAMTKPSKQLFVSTVTHDFDGKEKSPSIAYQRLLFLFPYLKEQQLSFDLSDFVLAEPAMMNGSGNGAVPAISEELTKRLFQDTLLLSQSKIESFVLCPYRFYCNYLLSLREKKPARIDYSDSGTFIHYFLEHFLKSRFTDNGEFLPIAEQEIEPTAKKIVNSYIFSHLSSPVTEFHTLHIFRRLYMLTLLLLKDILYELEHSKFRPCAFEMYIGGKNPQSPAPYEILLSDNRRILIEGKIDRVDAYTLDGKLYLRVIDYKSSPHEFSMDDVRSGLKLQLLIYLFAVCKNKEAEPAGTMYVFGEERDGIIRTRRTGLFLDDPSILFAMNDELKKGYFSKVSVNKEKQISGDALTSAEGFRELEQNVRGTLSSIGEDIFHGKAQRTPSADACAFCPLKVSCPEVILKQKY